jgi:hypothetical protein
MKTAMEQASPAPAGQPIIILGVQRSGTSLFGDLVHRWGAYGGDVGELTRGNIGNPRGYFEYRPMQHFLATQLGLDFWTPSYPQRLRERAEDPECREKALELVAGMSAQGSAWFWKEPLLSVTLPFWKQIWGDAVYVIPVRDPYDSATSWQKFSIPQEVRSRVSIVFANLLQWHYSMQCILEEMADVPHKLFLSYEAMVSAPQEHCGTLCRFLDQHCGTSPAAEGRLERMLAAIDPKLKRNSSATPFSDRPEATNAQKALYQFLLRRIDDPDLEFDAAAYPIYPGWREYSANIQFFRQFYADVSPILSSRWLALAMAASRRVHRIAGLVQRRKA